MWAQSCYHIFAKTFFVLDDPLPIGFFHNRETVIRHNDEIFGNFGSTKLLLLLFLQTDCCVQVKCGRKPEIDVYIYRHKTDK